MNVVVKRLALLLAALAALQPVASAAGEGATVSVFRDVLDTPARESRLADRSALAALAQAGNSLVAAGARGHVLWSEDGGAHWQQARVPVSSDLVALSFVDATRGWAAGHDAVILHTKDGGRSWQHQFDGRMLGTPQGPETPLLDICFVDAREGWAVGAFGLILHTEDGGVHWQDESKGADNPKGLHLYAARSIAGRLYLAGEQGLLLRRASNGRFEAVAQPYAGTLFGISGDASALLIHGLRGNALRSTDEGRSWQPVDTGVQTGLTASSLTPDGRWLLASQSGQLLLSRDGARTFSPLKLERPQPISAVIQGPRGIVTAGPRGVQLLPQ